MKFGKSLLRVVETSDPEWGPYWMNYKLLKRKINDINQVKAGVKIMDLELAKNPDVIAKSTGEVEFFNLLRSELKKSSDFFTSTETVLRIRKERIWGAFAMLKNETVAQDQNAWTRLLIACVNFYKDVLLIENFAIMTYCGFSKILKKHDKVTGFVTREAFMRKVMNRQNFARYPYVMELIKEAEALYANIQKMESVMPLRDEERLFIEVLREVNHQASMLQAVEKGMTCSSVDCPQSGSENSKESHLDHEHEHEEHDFSPRSDDTAEEEARTSTEPPADRRWDKQADLNLDVATASALQAAQRLHQAAQSLAHSNGQDHVSALRAAGASSAAHHHQQGERPTMVVTAHIERTQSPSRTAPPTKRTASDAGLDPV